MHHVEVIEDVCDFWILFGKLRAQLTRHRHKGPLDRWMLEIPMIGPENRFDGVLLGRQVGGAAQGVVYDDLEVVIGPDRRIKEGEFSSKGLRIGQGIKPAVI